MFGSIVGEFFILEISKILANITLRASSSFSFCEGFFHLQWSFSKGFIPFDFGLIIIVCGFWRSIVSWVGKTLILMSCFPSDSNILMELSEGGSFGVLEGILLNEVFELLEYFIFDVLLHSLLILSFDLPGFAVFKVDFHGVEQIRGLFLWFWGDNELFWVLRCWVLLLFEFFFPEGGKIIQFPPLQRLYLLGCCLCKGFNMH